jgi:hypothetical protein
VGNPRGRGGGYFAASSAENSRDARMLSGPISGWRYGGTVGALERA